MLLNQTEPRAVSLSKKTVCCALIISSLASQDQILTVAPIQTTALTPGNQNGFEVDQIRAADVEPLLVPLLQDASSLQEGHYHPCTVVDKAHHMHVTCATNEESTSHTSGRGLLLPTATGVVLCHLMSRNKDLPISSKWLDRLPRTFQFQTSQAVYCQNRKTGMNLKSTHNALLVKHCE
jgi:hypothetical protein